MSLFTFYFGMWVLANVPATTMYSAIQDVEQKFPGWMPQCVKIERVGVVTYEYKTLVATGNSVEGK